MAVVVVIAGIYEDVGGVVVVAKIIDEGEVDVVGEVDIIAVMRLVNPNGVAGPIILSSFQTHLEQLIIFGGFV